jgi:hypothetical protein
VTTVKNSSTGPDFDYHDSKHRIKQAYKDFSKVKHQKDELFDIVCQITCLMAEKLAELIQP